MTTTRRRREQSVLKARIVRDIKFVGQKDIPHSSFVGQKDTPHCLILALLLRLALEFRNSFVRLLSFLGHLSL